MNLKPVRTILGVLVFATILFSSIFYMGTRSEARSYAERQVRASDEIVRMLGDIRDVSFDPLGGYRERFFNSKRIVRMPLVVEGGKRKASVVVLAHRDETSWFTDEIIVDGVSLSE